MKQIADNIYSFSIALPDTPLKELNCYVIKPECGRSLIIDTGFDEPNCRSALMSGIKELDLHPQNTDVFLTHLHADHIGNAKALYDIGIQIIMGKVDYSLFNIMRTQEAWGAFEVSKEAGLHEQVLRDIFRDYPKLGNWPETFCAALVSDGDYLDYGSYHFRCIQTPGHTPGHICLFDEKKQLLFSGDHILFDISPNICIWPGIRDSLGDYLESLKLIQKLDIKLALPAHRSIGMIPVSERIGELLDHHSRRMHEIIGLLAELGSANAYQIAGRMEWNISASSWDDFPPSQKYFATSETAAHLRNMMARGMILCSYDELNVAIYSVKK